MAFGNIGELILPAIIFSLFVLIGNPLIVLTLMGILGYKKKTGFQAGFTVAQISEFSLILITLGVSVGHLTEEILSLVTIVGLITISCSTYLILYSNKLYPYFSRALSIFERKKARAGKEKQKDYDLILFGYNRIGYDLLKSFKRLGKKHIVIDYDPDTISDLLSRKIDCKYGDVDEDEFLNEFDFTKTQLVVSTIPEFETNYLLINKIREINRKTIVIVTSHSLEEANRLYEIGATYVIMPHFLGGTHAAKMIDNYKLDSKGFLEERKSHLKYLNDKKRVGHEHPKPEKDR